mmetsp:Transcript_37075/g.102037  ORF Transcript_37075/g.102037 Transcript_37075/m.102037 type:complete len:203 (+) Transcript_37075:480-1088(+)
MLAPSRRSSPGLLFRFSAVSAYQPRRSSRSELAPFGMVNLFCASCNQRFEKQRRRSQEAKTSPRKAQAPLSRSSMLSKMCPKSVRGSCPTRPMESGPASGPRPWAAIASTTHARASRVRRAMALRSAGAASSGMVCGDRFSCNKRRMCACRTCPARTAPRAVRNTNCWIDRGSNAGSRVAADMAVNAALNSSQPAHSQSPAP